MIAPPYNIGSLMKLYKINRDKTSENEDLIAYAQAKFKTLGGSKEQLNTLFAFTNLARGF